MAALDDIALDAGPGGDKSNWAREATLEPGGVISFIAFCAAPLSLRSDGSAGPGVKLLSLQ